VHSFDDIRTAPQWTLAASQLGDERLSELVPVLSLASASFRDAFFAHLLRIVERERGPRAVALALACALYDQESRA
jgi:hypothetical protein